jgi:hypothetical protein
MIYSAVLVRLRGVFERFPEGSRRFYSIAVVTLRIAENRALRTLTLLVDAWRVSDVLGIRLRHVTVDVGRKRGRRWLQREQQFRVSNRYGFRKLKLQCRGMESRQEQGENNQEQITARYSR